MGILAKKHNLGKVNVLTDYKSGMIPEEFSI